MHPTIPGLHPALDRLIESSWQAGLLVFLVLAVQAALRRHLTPAWHHALWWIVLGRLLILLPPATPWSLFNLLPRPGASPGNPPAAAEPARPFASTHVAPIVSGVPATRAPGDAAPPAPGTPPGTDAMPSSRTNPETPVSARPGFRPGKALAVLWAAGALILLVRGWVHCLHFARRVRTGMRPAPAPLTAHLDACRARLRIRKPVELLVGDVVPSPAIWGIARPRLLLPRHLAETASPERLGHIFLHELAHVRRGDPWIHLLTRTLAALHWFNPVLAWAFRRLGFDRELATDALALEVAGARERRAYGLTILELLEQGSRPPASSHALGILEDGASLERRFRAIAEFRPASRRAPLAALLLILLAAVSWSGAQPADPPTNPAAPAADPDRARQALDAGRRHEADTSLEQVLQASPDHPRAGLPEARTQDARRASSEDPASSTNSGGRQRIQRLLESIPVREMGFDRMALGDVVRTLKEYSRNADPGGRGVNFYLYQDPDASRSPVPAMDPSTGTPTPPQPEAPPLREVLVRLDPPLREVRLLDVLHAITRAAESPVDFVIEEYAVVFTHRPTRSGELVTRVIRLNGEFPAGLESTHAIRPPAASPAGRIPEPPPELQDRVRRFFQDLGVSLAPPNALFVNDWLGLLMVRATAREVEIVERAVAALAPDSSPFRDPAADGATIVLANVYVAAVTHLDALLRQEGEAGASIPAARARVDALRARLQAEMVVHPLPPLPPRAEDSAQLLLSRNGLWLLNGRLVTAEERERRLREYAESPSQADRPLRIWVEPSQPMSNLVAALDLARSAGIRHLSVSEEPLPTHGERFQLVAWKEATDLPPTPQQGGTPALVAFVAAWDVSSGINARLLESFRIQRHFEATRTELFRVDCTRGTTDPGLLARMHAYGVTNIPAYAVYDPARKAWVTHHGPLTEASLDSLLARR